jgi:preprotein translocase subunit YajC
MSLQPLNLFLAMAPAPQREGQPQSPAWTGIVPLVMLMVVFWFVLIRPQQKKAKQHSQMLGKIKAGDRVVTSSGIIGTVVHVKEKAVTVRTAGDTKLEFTKGAISEILEGSESVES